SSSSASPISGASAISTGFAPPPPPASKSTTAPASTSAAKPAPIVPSSPQPLSPFPFPLTSCLCASVPSRLPLQSSFKPTEPLADNAWESPHYGRPTDLPQPQV